MAPPSPEPHDLERLLPPSDDLGTRARGASAQATAAWNGIVWGRAGRGDLAWAWWREVDPDGPLAPWVAAERGRVLRELGLASNAQALERAGLEQAEDLVDMVLLRLSLAADAAALGEPRLARSRLDGATDLLAELPDTSRVARQRLRRSWVAVEVAQAEGAPLPTDGLPMVSTEGEVTQPGDVVHGTDHHRARGLLLAALARKRPELLVAAAELAPAALRCAVELARVETGDTSAPARAVAAWQAVVPPPDLAREVARTPLARRMAALAELAEEHD